MLTIYGPWMPARILEEVRFWKMQEKEHTSVLRQLIPDLEPAYVSALLQWEQALGATEHAAIQWIEAVVRSPLPVPPATTHAIHELVQFSLHQSHQFTDLLNTIRLQSVPVRQNPLLPPVIDHMIRESDYFIGVLQSMQPPASTHTPHTNSYTN